MSLAKLKKDKKIRPKTERKLAKLINESDSGSESEHELSHYLNDRVKLMKEVIRILKPKKIKNMAPTCMKSLNNEEISSMLLEELLGISNKRLKKIFSGQPQDDDTSSTDEEEEENSPDVISLDDVTDDDFVIDLDTDEGETKKKKRNKVKEEPKENRSKVKKEKHEKAKNKFNDGIMNEASEEHLMSVLELLELQARARAIRSQLALESSKKSQENRKEEKGKTVDNSDIEDAVIIESPINEEIVITSSDSESEVSGSNKNEVNKKTINNDDTHAPLTETEGSSGSSLYDKRNRAERSNKSDVEIVSNKLDVITENPEEINKLLNKFHKMKKRKRRSANQETSKLEKVVLKKISCRTECEESNKELEVISISQEQGREIDKPVAEKQNLIKDQQKNIFVDHSSVDGDDGIILDVDPAEMDSINLEPEIRSFTSEIKKSETGLINHTRNSSDMEHDKKYEEIREKPGGKLDEAQLLKIDNKTKQNSDEGEGIILNVDQSELDSINFD